MLFVQNNINNNTFFVQALTITLFAGVTATPETQDRNDPASDFSYSEHGYILSLVVLLCLL